MDVPRQVTAVLERTGLWWAIAGGWAIDLSLGAQTRDHHDVEIVVRRDQLPMVHAALAHDRSMYSIDPPGSGWQAWSGEPLLPASFQLQARAQGLEFDLFAETVAVRSWQFRRDPRVIRPVSEVTTAGLDGIPIVVPEIQLLYMAKSSDPKHDHDFHAVRPTLGIEARMWLARALVVVHPAHPWIAEL